MRVPVQKNKRTVRLIRMKANKKQSDSKPERDYISETISFVIKGKLTPIKTPFPKKKMAGAKKKDGDNAKPLKKATTKTAAKAQAKSAKKPTSGQKLLKNEDTAKKVAAKKSVKKVKTLEKKPVVKKEVAKRVKPPQKSSDAIDDTKQKAPAIKDNNIPSKVEDMETKQTIEKLLKQANRALKQSSKDLCCKNSKAKKAKADPNKKLKTSPGENKIRKAKVAKQSPVKQEIKVTKQIKRKVENCPIKSPEGDASTSDDQTLEQLRQPELPKSKKLKIKKEPVSDSEKKVINKKQQKKIPAKANLVLMKKRVVTGAKNKVNHKDNPKARKMKLFGFWNGPKRHRVASLNALAKVHCLYENETRNNLLDPLETVESKIKTESIAPDDDKKPDPEEVVCTRTLRSVPGLRAVGKHWDMHDTTSSSEDNNSGYESTGELIEKPKPSKVKKESAAKKSDKKPETKRRRNRTELMMDLKDMVVRKRMASLNASAILAASYSVEKRASKSPKSDSEIDSSDYFVTDNEEEPETECFETKVKKEEDGKVVEVRATPNKKVAVILNQDTDVTITGVYVNSTTRSTHHEGYCSIAGMQYRISATSHTQTAATAVATETLLQSSSSSTQENSNSESLTSCKSYTPLDALSNMQPPPGPGIQHQHMGPPPHVLPLSPSRRHGCPSAFSAPHAPPYPSGHHHPPPLPGEPGYVHGYYQPAGPLISVPHGHSQQPPITKSAPLSDPSPTSASPIHQPPPAPSSNGDSSDSEVIITSVTAGKEPVPPPQQQPPSTYRYTQYPGAPPGYSYTYPPHYYPTPPPPPTYPHHDLCYSTTPYLHHKYPPPPPPTYRRYLPSTQYYAPNPSDVYATPPAGPTQQTQQAVTSTPVSTSGSTYQPPPSGPQPAIMEPYPPPPTLVETYPHPPHYYPSYGPAPPSCYTHSPATRTLPYINTTYQTCPCPMQSCPKNVLTGPLTGDSKRSNIAKDSMPLPPVALALPLEPASATGPPSPARGSAGMPPPPSPAGATYQPPPPAPKQETNECNPVEKKRKARVGKAMVRNNIAAIQQNTMLLMCNPNQRNFPGEVKREIESPKEKQAETKKEICSSDDENNKNAQDINSVDVSIQQEVNTSIEEAQELKKECSVVEIKEEEKSPCEEKQKEQEELPPCINTVAENVKVKNMKRKLSLTKEKNEDVETPSPVKKIKVEQKYVNGSYKDLIKKDTTTIKINNGKRKLISKAKTSKKPVTKRKLSATREKEVEETVSTPSKRLKQQTTKPLTASNLQNSKQYSNICKEKQTSEPILIENKEPLSNKKCNKKLPVNSKASAKKLAPAILDSLIARNSIDRTIECVISESSSVRTSASKTVDKCAKTSKQESVVLSNRKSTNNHRNGQIKNNNNNNNASIKSKVECRKSLGNRRKSKCKEVVPQPIARVPRRSLVLPRWSNGWAWEGEPFEAKVFLNSDETTIVRRCYPAMRHEEGDIIEVRDCVLLKAGPRKNDLPFVAKIAYLWENPDDGEMMMSLLWYYRPEHTEQGRLPADQPDEVFASRHKDSNSVACIDDKCFVLTFHEYCRYRKNLRRLEEGLEETLPCIPNPEPYPRSRRQPPSSVHVSSDMVFFCRRVYDFRQKRIVKNPS